MPFLNDHTLATKLRGVMPYQRILQQAAEEPSWVSGLLLRHDGRVDILTQDGQEHTIGFVHAAHLPVLQGWTIVIDHWWITGGDLITNEFFSNQIQHRLYGLNLRLSNQAHADRTAPRPSTAMLPEHH